MKNLSKGRIANRDGTDITITRRTHPLWLQHSLLAKERAGRMLLPCPIGKYQYFVESPIGAISIVELPNYFHDGVTLWKFYCISGKLFDDEPRFGSLGEAINASLTILIQAANNKKT